MRFFLHAVADGASLELSQKRRMPGEHSEVTLDSWRLDLINRFADAHAFGGDDFELDFFKLRRTSPWLV